jgi:hypothetical protein
MNFIIKKKNLKTKNAKNTNGWNHDMKNKKEGQRKAKRHVVCKKKTREKASPFHVRSYFTHSPFNVTYMEIVRFNSNRRFKTNISHQHNFLFYSKVKAN